MQTHTRQTHTSFTDNIVQVTNTKTNETAQFVRNALLDYDVSERLNDHQPWRLYRKDQPATVWWRRNESGRWTHSTTHHLEGWDFTTALPISQVSTTVTPTSNSTGDNMSAEVAAIEHKMQSTNEQTAEAIKTALEETDITCSNVQEFLDDLPEPIRQLVLPQYEVTYTVEISVSLSGGDIHTLSGEIDELVESMGSHLDEELTGPYSEVGAAEGSASISIIDVTGLEGLV